MKANRGVRARVPAAGKVLEGDDQQIYVHYITIINLLLLHREGFGKATTLLFTTDLISDKSSATHS